MSDSERQLNINRQNINSQIKTNEAFKDPIRRSEQTYYFPCYVRFLIKEIEKVSAADMESEILGTLIFSFHYGDTELKYVQEFVSKQEKKPAILLQFNKEQSIELREGKGITKKHRLQTKMIEFIIRKRFKANLRGHVFLTPFQILDMYLQITVQSVHFTYIPQNQRERNKKRICIKFNCMNSANPRVNIIRHGKQISFGNYRIASSMMEAQFTNSRENPYQPIGFCTCCQENDDYEEDEEEKKKKRQKKKAKPKKEQKEASRQSLSLYSQVEPYQYAHFRIPIYRYPGISILTIFIPIQILGAIGLLVFFQSPKLSDRLATIAVLILAFVAFLPTINESIPQTPTIKLVQILILMHLAAIILLGTESFLVKDENEQKFKFVWQENNYYLAAMVLNIFTFSAVFVLFVFHKCFWQRKLKSTVPGILLKNPPLIKQQWGHSQCDKQFSTKLRREIA